MVERIHGWNPEDSLSVTRAPALADDEKVSSLLRSIDRSLQFLDRIPDSRSFQYGPTRITKFDLEQTLLDFRYHLLRSGLNKQFFKYVQQNYTFYKPPIRSVHFTGYFEPELEGSLQQTKQYQYPLYQTPPDLLSVDKDLFLPEGKNKIHRELRGRVTKGKKVVPYFSRTQIDSRGALQGKGLEIAWVKDPIDAFFLHIQGSGSVRLPGGKKIQVSYANKNGHPYRAIGKYMVQKGMVERKNLSMQKIKRYLRNNPGRVHEIFQYNPSYVFFRRVKEGPVGSLDVPLTGGRSIATDKRLFPAGSIAFVSTKKPVTDNAGNILDWKEFSRFVLNQDTGGAIKGPGRVDFFTGSGNYAEVFAGNLNTNGNMYFLLRKPQSKRYASLSLTENSKNRSLAG